MLKRKKHTILFVDDEELILRGIKRSIDEYSDFWDVEFVTSGKQALETLSKHNFDAIISDMLMPEMDGLKLLERVDEDFPGVLRFVLSGNASDIQILKSTHLVHQMFPKPCPIEHIFDVVERSCHLRDELSEPNLIRIITGIKTLPSMPALYNQILRELQADEPDPKIVAKIIGQDTAMTAKILQLVNSAFFGLADRVSSPQRAVSILGLNTVKALVLSIHIFSEYQNNPNLPFSVDELWKHSISVGGLARKISLDMRLNQPDQDDVQVAAILHDIGKLLELKIPNFFRRVKIEKNHVSLEAEYQILGTSHAEMGAYLLGIWGLPAHIVESVMLHHKPGLQVHENINILSVLHIANGLINMCELDESDAFDRYLDTEYIKRVGVFDHLNEWAQFVRNNTSA